MRILVRSFACLLAVAAWCGCGLLGKKKPNVPEATLPTWLGRVVMVDEGNRFALVDTGAPVRLAPGTKLLSFREQRRSSSLVVTPENHPPYLAVDIADGLPSLGDQVALDESVAPAGLPAEL